MSKTITIDTCMDCPYKRAKDCYKKFEFCPLPDSRAAQQAMLDEVIDMIRNHTEKEIETPEYDGVDCAIQELKQKYGGKK